MAELRLDLSRIDQHLLQNYGEDEGEPLEGLDPFMDDFSIDEKLSPLERLDKYFQSEDLGERELAVRLLSEAIQHVTSYAEFELLLEIAFALANDHEPIIRVGVLGVVGCLLDSNEVLGGQEEYTTENEERLFDVPIRMLADINQQVRRVSQNCIIILLEDEKGTRDILLHQLCPMIVRCLNRDENYDLRMDTALLMSRVASLLGKELCMRHFVPLLPSLGSDTMFHVRKAFAMSCKELCPVLGEDGTEQHILPIFLRLCKDEVWGVRKACADVFSDISMACNLGTRHDFLTPVFLRLLNDDSRWVRKAAFQCLGPFISTFYVPNGDDTTVANFDDSSIDPLGDSVLMDNSLLGSSSLSTVGAMGNQTQDSGSEDRQPKSTSTSTGGSNHSAALMQAGSNHSSTPKQNGTGGKLGLESRGEGRQGVEDEFGSFSFWRSPIPNLGSSGGQKIDLHSEDQSPSTAERNSGSGSGGENSRFTDGNTHDSVDSDDSGASGNDSVALGKVKVSEIKTKLDFEDAAPSEGGTLSEAVLRTAVEGGSEERKETVDVCGGLEQPTGENTSKDDEPLLPEVEVNTQAQEHGKQGDSSAHESTHESGDGIEQTSHQPSQEQSPQQVVPGSQQPGEGPQQPGEGSQQPGEGSQQPGEGPQQPGEGPQQPGEGSQQPGEGSQQPGEGPQQPGEGSQQPGEGSRQPGEGSRQPGEGSQQPGEGLQQPGEGSQQPGEGLQQPGEGSQQPGESLQQPGEGSQQPGEGSRQPGEGSQQPGEGSRQPGEGSRQPGEGSQQPGEGPQQPGEGPQQPGEGSQQPGEGSQQPGEGSQQPGEGSQQPGEGSQQPGEGSQQPGEGSQQPGEDLQGSSSDHSSTAVSVSRRSEDHEELQESGSDPNTQPPVRVFVHSTCGLVIEQDLSLVGHELCEDEPSLAVHDSTTDHSVAMDLTLGVSALNPPQQEIVPDELMEVFLSMTDHTKAQTVDSELPYYCAYSFPAVTLTLGQQHWNLLKPTFDLLAADMQWKIRRVLAHSLHELARILGAGHTSSDLLPVFEEYCTKDVDDVKVGVLAHLAEFFELLPSSTRAVQLPSILGGLVDVENVKNWRYRNTLAEQLMSLCELYDCDYLHTHIYPVALSLAEDKVAEVRATATQLLGILLYLMSKVQPEQFLAVVRELRERYASHQRWLFRLMYVKQCGSFLTEGRISCEVFASECLPTLIQLSKDNVANIRIAVAKLLKDTVLSIDYFQTDGKDTFSLEELRVTLRTLQYDTDRDVRYFAGGPVLFDPSPFLRQRLDSESHESEEQYQDASEYLESETAEPVEAKDTSASSSDSNQDSS